MLATRNSLHQRPTCTHFHEHARTQTQTLLEAPRLRSRAAKPAIPPLYTPTAIAIAINCCSASHPLVPDQYLASPHHRSSLPAEILPILGSWSDRGYISLFSSPHIRCPLPSIADGHQPSGHHDPTPPYGPRHPLVHCLLVSCICALLAIYIDPASRIPISQSSPRG